MLVLAAIGHSAAVLVRVAKTRNFVGTAVFCTFLSTVQCNEHRQSNSLINRSSATVLHGWDAATNLPESQTVKEKKDRVSRC